MSQQAYDEVSRTTTFGTCRNPAIRRKTIDGRRHEVGRLRNSAGQTLVINLWSDFSDRPKVMVGRQKLEVCGPDGRLVDSRESGLEFSPVDPDEIISKASAVGLDVVDRLGDSSGSAFDPASSPTFIAVLGKAGRLEPSRAGAWPEIASVVTCARSGPAACPVHSGPVARHS
jgi:hypothetical protein